MVAAGVPQLHVGLGEPVVDVEVGRLELEDAHHVRRAVLLRYGVLRGVRDEVGEHRLAGLGNKDGQCHVSVGTIVRIIVYMIYLTRANHYHLNLVHD